ncbi:hypothetical protein [Jannaschia ovalis]|uniref:Uncharacterized protein n=1 Tax=Jannaschia ovalis TaxID=3038773 RepID=A0ABY8LDL7_9RHOB|nr:hypothetical protein [Jannaschia sp. GRR-S6-38]WGH79246.1 hypothetical protein P8627_02990 [Jannaschia sp. GRR-S6-38]
MRAHDMTEFHRRDLHERNREARAELEARTAEARAFGEQAPQGYDEKSGLKLYHFGGHWAMLFSLWFAFVTPIVLILIYWD